MAQGDAETVVEVRGLGKRYKLYPNQLDRMKELFSPTRKRYSKDKWAVQNLDFTVERGSVYGLIGRNGAGKSTTLKILAGRLSPTTGTVKVKGRVSSILELGTGLQPGLTGRQNARINALFMGLDPWRVEETLEHVLSFAGLGEYADQPLEFYSSGMKARLAFSVLTALEPEILLLDEALATGDARFQEKCTALIRGLCFGGATTIVVSHDLHFMIKACSHLTWLEDGAPVAQGDPKEVVTKYLDSLGQNPDFRYRPRHMVLRIRSDEPQDYFAQSAYFLDDDEEISGLWHFNGEQEFLESAAQVGFSRERAERGWSGCQEKSEGRTYRRLKLGAGKEGGVLVSIPVPPPPAALPTRLCIAGIHDHAKPIHLDFMRDGVFIDMGEFPNDTASSAFFPLDLERLWPGTLDEVVA